ncbi:MAG: family 16 glycoside hydrolase, partial [Bacteroidota bacterium]
MNINFNYRLLIFLILSTLLATKSQGQKNIKLFNQKNLKGWYAYEPVSGKQNDASKVFHTEKKMIRLYGDKIGYLMSEKSFKNFQLTIEYKWNTDSTVVRKSSKKNSGIMYLVPTTTPDTLWPKGIQFQ